MLILGLVTTRGYSIWSEIVQEGVRLASAGIVSGVVDAERSLGETMFEDVIAGMKPLRDACASAFAWNESRLIGESIRPQPATYGVDVESIRGRRVENRLGGEATRIDVVLGTSETGDTPTRLLIVIDGHVRGVLVRVSGGTQAHFAGYVPVLVDDSRIVIMRVSADGTRIDCMHNCAATVANTEMTPLRS